MRSRNNTSKSNNHKGGQMRQKECHFCTNGMTEIDYRDTKMLQRFTSSYAKILPRKKTGVCAKHQRKLAQAIKRARVMALIPFTTR